MSAPQPIRRDMSYRKPVPKYIPSPPPSPRSSPNSPHNRQSLSMESIMYDDMPPLPSGWRDAIDRATSKDKRTFGGAMTDMDGGNGSPTSVRGSPRREQVSSPWMNDESDSYSTSDYGDEALVTSPPTYARSWAQSPRTSRKRTLPLDYRPPTPPLPAYVKQGRPPHESTTVTFSSTEYHTIFPDPPPVLNLNSIIPRNIIDEKTSNAGRPDLQPSTPFRTETTQSTSVTVTRRSSSSTQVDALIPDARETWLRETWCILPILPDHQKSSEDQDSEEKGWPSSDAISNQARRFWERLSMLGHLLRMRLRNLRAAPFSSCDCDLSISSA